MFGRISVNKVIKHNDYYSKESTKQQIGMQNHTGDETAMEQALLQRIQTWAPREHVLFSAGCGGTRGLEVDIF